MKVIIAGSRTIRTEQFVEAMANQPFDVSEVVSGTAKGADQMGEFWADLHDIPVARFPAEWVKYGKSAGYRRNVEMADYADALIAVWDGESRGTKHMIDIAEEKGLEVFVYNTMKGK